MVKAQTASNNGRLLRYLMDIQHYNFRLYYKKGKIHLDADAVSRLLKCGENPVYLNADDLEWDKGPVTEEEMMVAKDIAEKRLRRIQRADDKKARYAEEQERDPVAEVQVCGLMKELAVYNIYESRMRQRVQKPQTAIRANPGYDSLDDMVSPEAVESLVRAKKCGYQRIKVVTSTIAKAGHG
jgi:hypothetical protein